MLAQAVWPDNRQLAWLSMSFAAFNPMFLFITASVLLSVLLTLGLSLLVKFLNR